MSYEINNISTNAPDKIISAIKTASNKSGVDFSYLVKQAKAESSFNPDAKSKTSSATGLYQFIDKTWLSMIDQYGKDYGLNTENKTKSEILAMRKDPEAASFMAAAFASENEKTLNNNWGGDVGATELYFAHFLGASGASSFLNARDENPMRPAADLFPRAARANRNVFYNPQDGKPRTLEEVYSFFDKKFQNSPTTSPKTGNEIYIANAPIPPQTPEQKIAQNDVKNDSYIDIVPRNSLYGLSNSVVMQRSQEMREHNALKGGHGAIFSGYDFMNINNFSKSSLLTKTSATDKINYNREAAKSPFFGRIANNLDLIMLTQKSRI